MKIYSHLSTGLKTYLELQKPVVKRHPEEGFTIIESLIAMVVITIVVVAITPPIFLAVATRVQNQKAEQAMQLAQRQVDKIRILSEKGGYADSDLPPLPSTSSEATGDASAVGAPTNFSVNPSDCITTPASSNACPVYLDRAYVDATSTPNFYLQTFRTKETRYGTPSQAVAFQMGVRVYAAIAKGQSGLLTGLGSLKFTTEQGQQRKYPLAVMYTSVVRSDLKDSLTTYKGFLCIGITTSPCPTP
ncbi:MAG: prepilin-type N-terminal cleavage/methylation domain-containing protein [Nostoc sp.]|uniref:prepilin-type N-terminal cleavage/methylation domain-containing protein n=1 Tax=Nostoc sp. TaxID=1180 RepID=UPI002FF7C086